MKMTRMMVLVCAAIIGCWRCALSNRYCPDLMIDSCHCTAERSKEFNRQTVRVKVICDDADLTETMPPSSLPNNTVSLLLSNNKISVVRNNSFTRLGSLERLDLRGNLISRISPGAFNGLTALKRLDLSNNRIGCFSPDMFLNLGRLSKLNLSGNIFSTLPEGLFTHLPSLRTLHFSTDYLFCDCQLQWLLEWIRAHSLRVGNESVCVYPTRLHGLEFSYLQEHQLTCDGPLELPVLQLIPSQRQLVFHGDRLPLQCTASYLHPSVKLTWVHEQRPVHTLEERSVHVEESIIHDCCLITSELILSNIDVSVSGNWHCHVTSSRGNSSIGMEIVVLETSAVYCSAERISTNKGDFRWPKTLAGLMAFLPCTVPSFSSASHEKRAWRRCDRTGHWTEDDYNQCSYTSELTRSLHKFTQIPVNISTALALAQQISSFTSRAALFGDMMDVIFVTHLVERLTRLVDHIRELSDHVFDIASNMMQVDEHILWMAQNEARACTRIVQCVERIADVVLNTNTSILSKISPNIALEAFRIQSSGVMGLLCATVVQRLHIAPPMPDSKGVDDTGTEQNTLLNIRCHTVNASGSPINQLSQDTVPIASIHLPLSIDNGTCTLQLIVFRNGKLFPRTGNSSNLADDGKRRSVSTPVAFTKLDGCSPVQPVTVSLRHWSLGVDPTAAYWDFELLDGHGGWRADGCHITGSGHNATTISCAQGHSNLAVLMDLKKVLSFPPYPGDFLHPVVYACTAVMLLCLFASIITYIVHHSTIRISRKGWHILLNFCFHTALTFTVFAGGINRIKYPIICQAVGVVLHFSSLSTIIWLGVTARNIYKQVTRKAQQAQDGDLPPAQPAKSPMLRFYLISEGVPIIICGITAAINTENYGSGEQTPFCWMAWEPSLGAFYAPTAFIILVTCIYFLCTFIQLRKHPERKYELKTVTEEQQRLADVTHCHHQGEPEAPGTDGGRCHEGCPGLINPCLLVNEHSFKAQLRTAAFTLFLFMATWTFGALAVSQGHFLDMIFSCLYGAFSVTLGLFILIHHCAKRDDVWHCWCSCCPGRRPKACQGHVHGRPKVNVNGDTHSHCHPDSPCKSILSHSHCRGSGGLCKRSGQNHVTCLSPVSPCCAVLHTQQLLEDEASPRVLLHADPEGYRPAVHLHRCLKPSRTKARHQGCHRAVDRELSFHITSSSADGGSAHSSRTNSPHSLHERQGHVCHLAHEGHHLCHHEAPVCHAALCHQHVCCAKDELLCQPEAGETGTYLCSCGKIAEDEIMATHHVPIEMHPRRQSINLRNQNGILKGSVNEGLIYPADTTGNIRTGPWRNETTV
ncbi:adhesion G protein-coupled receptor A3 isoform X1 [Misgurnus anguillicaudatus]|uniref:adhesion G protein-coupled receptor A3 isoform X1 n=2 Tax=Misgurnus anguillicaudatus TaxID=75329 RepID=UPI003CCF340F